MRQTHIISGILLLAALSFSGCQETVVNTRPTVPVVERILSGAMARESSLLSSFDPKDAKGSIAVVGPSDLAFSLSLRFLNIDEFDNVDGRRDPDMLPDFAGETVDVVMDEANAPYHRLMVEGRGDSIRAVTVRNLTAVIDTLCSGSSDDVSMSVRRMGSKVVVFPSPYMSLYGAFDVDTLLRSTGAQVPVVFPVKKIFGDILDSATDRVRVAVLTDSTTAQDQIHMQLFEQMAKERQLFGSECIAFPRDTVGDVLQNFLAKYKGDGGMLPFSYVVIDDPYVDAPTVRHSLADLSAARSDESKLLTSDCRVMDTFEVSTDECYRILRKNNIFTHDIAYPRYKGSVTVQSADGHGYRLVGTDRHVSDKR